MTDLVFECYSVLAYQTPHLERYPKKSCEEPLQIIGTNFRRYCRSTPASGGSSDYLCDCPIFNSLYSFSGWCSFG